MSENTTPTPDARGWPDAERPGVPLRADEERKHWLIHPLDVGKPNGEMPAYWDGKGWWLVGCGRCFAPSEIAPYRYLAPCLTPAQVDAAVQAECAALLDACKRLADVEVIAASPKDDDLVIVSYSMVRQAREAIRARGTTDALAQQIAEAEKRGAERMRERCSEACIQLADKFGDAGELYAQCSALDCAEAIRALTSQEPQG